jgi:hypothetical protein
MGKVIVLEKNKENTVKLDLYYTDDYIQPAIEVDGIRMATIEEIISMKLEVIQGGGRKRLWDLHELLRSHDLSQMLDLHEQRYPYSHKDLIIKKLYIL